MFVAQWLLQKVHSDFQDVIQWSNMSDGGMILVPEFKTPI